MRRLRRPRGTNQVHGRLQLDHRVHRVGRMLAHHSPVVGRGSPVADALHTVGWDHDSLAAGVAAVGREKCCGLGRSLAGTAHAEGHHSHVGEAARRDRAMVEGTGSGLGGKGYDVPDRTGRAVVVHTPGPAEGSPDSAVHSHAVAAAGMRCRGCSRSLDRGLGPDRSNPDPTCCS